MLNGKCRLYESRAEILGFSIAVVGKINLFYTFHSRLTPRLTQINREIIEFTIRIYLNVCLTMSILSISIVILGVRVDVSHELYSLRSHQNSSDTANINRPSIHLSFESSISGLADITIPLMFPKKRFARLFVTIRLSIHLLPISTNQAKFEERRETSSRPSIDIKH